MPSILWLGRDFRFDDNAALAAAAKDAPVLAVFILDAATRAQGAASRWRLQRALIAFDAEWHARTRQHITLLEGEAADLLPALAARIGARAIHQNDWPTPAQKRAQQALRKALSRSPTRLHLHAGHLLVDPAAIRTGSGGSYRVYTPFAKAVRAHGPDAPVSAPASIAALPAEGPRRLEDRALAPDMRRGAAALEEHALPAGEAAALDRLERFLDRAGGYADGRNRPDLDATSGLSEHLALGEISPRRVWSTTGIREGIAPELGAGMAVFLSELLWREFAWHLMLAFPDMPERPWKEGWDSFPWKGAGPQSEGWRRGETGIALVDAGLRQMRVTGRMHNRVRMVVASWLTKHLLTNWRVGLRHFEDSLTDWDPAANAMNWQWVAGCGPDASPFFRIFNPEKQAATFDPDGRYRRYWLHGDGAAAYRRTLPGSWNGGAWQGGDTAQLLVQGRARALSALEMFNRQA